METRPTTSILPFAIPVRRRSINADKSPITLFPGDFRNRRNGYKLFQGGFSDLLRHSRVEGRKTSIRTRYSKKWQPFGIGTFQSDIRAIKHRSKNIYKDFYSDRIIVSNILNLLTAVSACGSLAGMMIISPFFNWNASPETVTSASPSMI